MSCANELARFVEGWGERNKKMENGRMFPDVAECYIQPRSSFHFLFFPSI
jgi:hypothetical protein